MTGNMFPQPTTREQLVCAVCGASVSIHPEADAPEGWREYALPCGMLAFCPLCQRSWGGISVLKRNAEDIHRDRGGCVGCTTTPTTGGIQ